ncbi:hypothetical protein GCM10023328_10290 [Modestobacter marinus]|uniref:Uncharacterized protein n=1 Tax=Modestobacter marinus TaxID=477641 RepID=A0A846LRD8_9ACTN|nr:hypothetical protein [Modestobacter marinus]NIH69957.1 hypothetical protein [Modestobacter marinus]GGL82408.1 hypothetical protein GCM10011589_43560 [Modestobacter marinus]
MSASTVVVGPVPARRLAGPDHDLGAEPSRAGTAGRSSTAATQQYQPIRPNPETAPATPDPGTTGDAVEIADELAAGALPLGLGGVLTAGLLSRALPRLRTRLLVAACVAVGAGLVLAGLFQGWLGALAGDWLANSAVLALGLLAVAWTLLGLYAPAGDLGPGRPIGHHGAARQPAAGRDERTLPAGWSVLGQLLPPGATVSAVRSVAFFDGAGAAGPLWVLTGWVALGLLLAPLAALREQRRPARVEQGTAKPVAVPA